jgi:hypothetical protein
MKLALKENIKRNYPNLINAIKSEEKYYIKLYDKKYHYESINSGEKDNDSSDGYVTYVINPKHYENDVKAIVKELDDVRFKLAVANKKYKPNTPLIKSLGLNKGLIPSGSIKHSSNFIPYQDGHATTMLIIGSSKVGKSTLFRYIFQKFYQNDKKLISFLYTGSPQIDLYKKLKNLDIVPFFNKDCEDLINVQRYINSETNNNYNFLEIFDDILNIRYKELVSELVCKDRNSNISSIISIQDFSFASPSIRNNVNSFALFAPNTLERNEKFVINILKPYLKKILGNDCTLNEMTSFFTEVTKDHGYVYIIPSKQHISFHRLNLKDIKFFAV